MDAIQFIKEITYIGQADAPVNYKDELNKLILKAQKFLQEHTNPPKGWKVLDVHSKEAAIIIADNDIEIEGDGNTIIQILESNKGFWICRHANGSYGTVAGNDDAYGTFEDCVSLLENEFGKIVDTDHL